MVHTNVCEGKAMTGPVSKKLKHYCDEKTATDKCTSSEGCNK
jgi:hypothetical protein